MRSEVPNPFGTSLVDLLVGALAIVALLWMLAALNSGYSGIGNEDRTSGMITIDQFGLPHLVSVRLTQPGRFNAKFRLEYSEEKSYMVLDNFEEIDIDTVKIIPPLSSEKEMYEKAVYDIFPTGINEPVTVTLRVVAPDGDFYKGLHITVENLDSVPLIARVGIEACCSSQVPHYLRTMSMSGNGEREELFFWHEAGKLEKLLKNTNLPQDNWIKLFARRIQQKKTVHMHTFFVSNEHRYYDENESPEGESCFDMRQSVEPSILTIRFEPDGDIWVRPPNTTNETPGASAQHEQRYMSFSRSFHRLLDEYSTRVLDQSGPGK